jgi:large subunit ribosomal protein L4
MSAGPATLSRPVRKVRPEPQARTVERRQPDGTVLGQVTLDPQIFGIEPNAAVLHQVVTAQLAAARSGTQSTKTRSEVAGGGAKPYKQKGTGRARQGSIRAPQWTGGGVALGPKPRSYKQHTPKKMIQLALSSALSDRAAGDRVALVDAWAFEAPRTKEAAAALEALGLSGKVLVVLERDDLDAAYSFRNLPDVHIVASAELNAYDVLRHDWVVFTDGSLPGDATPVAGATKAAKAPAKAAKAPAKAAKAPAKAAAKAAKDPAEADRTPAKAAKAADEVADDDTDDEADEIEGGEE